MTHGVPVSLRSVEMAIAVANTPPFLLRKLKKDPAIYELSRKLKPAQIFSELKSHLSRKPKSVEDLAWAYAYLFALFLAGEWKFIRAAKSLDAPHHAWFEYLANSLAVEFQPTNIQQVRIPQNPVKAGLSSKSGTQTSRRIVQLQSAKS